MGTPWSCRYTGEVDPSPDRITWTLRRTAPDGRVLEAMDGTLVRADR